MNRHEILNFVEQKYQKPQTTEFRVGDTVRVHARIVEGDTTRVQAFEGIVISFTGLGISRMFTVRKISFGVGVERIFPINSPVVDKIEVLRSGHARRAKLYYLRDRVGRAAKLEEKDATGKDAKKSVHAEIPAAALTKAELVSTPQK
jgi:large subunit ribosomal protein L19